MIICTNPPFSVWREYYATLKEHETKFLIVGQINCVAYKNVFPDIKNDQLWLGYNHITKFAVPEDTEIRTKTFKLGPNGEIYLQVSQGRWFSNIAPRPVNQRIELAEQYEGNEDKWPTYDNYNAIECSRVKMIPNDYDDVMGVPITWLDKYSPTQFEIIGGYNYSNDMEGHPWNAKINGQYVYKRILIRRRPEDIERYGKR